MPIKKQEFYEGAALHLLTRRGRVTSIRYDPPFFGLNGDVLTLLKYSTRIRSPWGFTFMPAEQKLLASKSLDNRVIIGLVCGADGVVALPYNDFLAIAAPREMALHVACYRDHGEFYAVSGPDGVLNPKISPSNWQRILG